MSASGNDPNSRQRTVTGTAFGAPYERVEAVPPAPLEDAKAALLTLVVTVLLGAPLGLLWAGIAPHVDVVVMGQQANLTEAYTDGFIAADAYFLAAVALAGVVGGLIAYRLGSAHGPVVVLALTVGGLVAAFLAMRVGEQIGLEALRDAVRTGSQGRFELNLELKAREALVGWPLGSLLAYLLASLVWKR